MITTGPPVSTQEIGTLLLTVISNPERELGALCLRGTDRVAAPVDDSPVKDHLAKYRMIRNDEHNFS